MNEKLLAHHTKLFDWFELDKIAKDNLSIEKSYMTPIKANAVNSWSDDSLTSEELPEVIPPVRTYKPHISMRSDSNQLLNYLTVDDCRVAARYKPRHDINYIATYDEEKAIDGSTRLPDDSGCSEETTELPMKMSTGSVLTTLSSLKEQDQMFRALLKKKRKLEAVKSSSYHRIINNLETKHKLPEADKLNLEIGAEFKRGSHFYRKINSALHKKIDKLVNAKKENMRGMIV
ncbi:hypothetical protein LOTGIDRAFT_156446 [Lottia gigantea]|uniref:Uncharacterized protein n=1 Tax=Lottia gigantea TaxID=225164 RepID=V4AIH5_LOTGI|nr:hypothetical protein LOTGIDRAFT_156446 [Lottia gigantea]ESP03849.1 hypothetical protein LOTGIDRAFT_156446 [Lottia gigantea]